MTNSLAFRIEWEEAPGVRDAVLARTWARLTIQLGDFVLTRGLDLHANSERDGVYGSLFPLAEWLVENFWFITSEAPRGRVLSPRDAPKSLHGWMSRHNLLNAGAGSALPNLTLASDGSSSVLAAWFHDDALPTERRTIRFLDSGRLRFPARDLEIGVNSLVTAVLMRLERHNEEEVVRLRRDWEAIGASMRDEESLCRRLAQLGLDPYLVEDDAIDTLETAIATVPTSLQGDLLNSESLDTLGEAARYAAEGAAIVAAKSGRKFSAPKKDIPICSRASELGYRLAHAFRKGAGIPHDSGVPDLETVMTEQDVSITAQAMNWENKTRVRSLVGFSQSHTGVLVTPSNPSPAARRFLLGRALGACLLGQCDGGPRLLTEAQTWDQAAARAFAAELLAPQAALAQRIRAVIGGAEVHDLAAEFEVNELVVVHQIENHRLATIVPD